MSGGLSRRTFLRLGASAGGGLLVGVGLGFRRPGTGEGRLAGAGRGPWMEANAFVEIARDGRVRIGAPVPEMGQGVHRALPRLVAHELRVDPSTVVVWQPPADARYGSMAAAGSDAVVDYFEPLRAAGAAARRALVRSAAARWDVDPASCRAEGGYVAHPPTRRRLGYGELAADAAALPDEEGGEPGAWPAMGPDVALVDAELQGVVTGRARFGIDVREEHQLFATVLRPPVAGARVVSFDASAARSVPGVVDVVGIAPRMIQELRYGAVRGGVAVVAASTWAAMRGRDALSVTWDRDAEPGASDAALFERMREAASAPPERTVRARGEGPPPDDVRWIRARYELPLLAHASLEPCNFTARVTEEGCAAWGPTQNPRFLRTLIAAALDLPEERVSVQATRIGGGFGRRLAQDYGVEAALLARHTSGRPVQIVWTREDDFQHDYFRPPSVHELRAAVDPRGEVVAWEHHLVTSSLARHTFGPDADAPAVYDVQGADDVALAVPWVRLGHTSVDLPLQLGSFRSVAHSFNVFAVASFVGELAHALGVDLRAMHRRLLGPARRVEVALDLPGRRGLVTRDTGRIYRVLDAAADAVGRGRASEPGTGVGLAWSVYKGTYVAHAAVVRAGAAGSVVERVVAAVDCGTVVDPDGVRAQAEGAVIDGLATVLHWGVPFRDGRPSVHNFGDYPLVRIDEAPVIDVILLPSGDPPTGMGEPPYPSVAPAITEALFRATGRRVRRLPLDSPARG